ncbi:hypothetical protein GCM10023329_07860 [Streptomyces sanyensis]|uniref:Cupin type-2 domain-containing protein n=1 Tax=Streptomyces sanyensis TaxID=568869 RepID=A0ABP8ZTD1_9ACTN
MAPRRTHGVLATAEELLAEAPPERGGVLWALSPTARQLDANLVRLPPGGSVAAHGEPDLDVLLCVLEGGGALTVAGEEQLLGAGALVWLPRGARRSLAAGPEGLVYLTAHRRRPGLTIGSAPPGGARGDGGEPPCLADRLCPACDRPAEAADARFCARCGTRLPD